MILIKPSLIFLLLSLSFWTQANSIDSARMIENKANKTAISSQQKIDESAQATLNLKAKIEQLSEEVNNLTIYREHLSRLVTDQNLEVSSLNEQIQGIQETRQGVVPLMYKMIDELQVIIAQDKPLKSEQRLARISKLKVMMSQANISDAEKYRRILETYQIEMDYGNKLGRYQGEIQLSAEQRIEADLLYLGRIALLARSLDRQQYWSWNVANKQWQSVDIDAEQIDIAFSMAAKQSTPDLINLPISLKYNALTNKAK